MSNRVVFLLLLTFIVIFLIIVGRWIAKLPSKYERQPRNLTPWNSLDIGIDPSISEKPKQ
jgi:hypothetical protein